ncbi:MAG: hypothetical protein LIO85_04970 [Rikenellaceae bacterium]|nr:hypothetical protein [Rikenellaceae bacterium]
MANRRSGIKLKWHILSHLGDNQLVWMYEETGVREYFSELFMRYLPLIYGMALKYVPDEEQAKDSVKRLFDVLLEEFDRSDLTNDVFRDWLYRHSHEFYVAYAKQNRLHERNYFATRMENGLSDRAFECAGILESGSDESQDLLETARPYLSKHEYTCLELFFIRRRSFRSISSATGYLAGSVKRYIETGLEKMAAMPELEPVL